MTIRFDDRLGNVDLEALLFDTFDSSVGLISYIYGGFGGFTLFLLFLSALDLFTDGAVCDVKRFLVVFCCYSKCTAGSNDLIPLLGYLTDFISTIKKPKEAIDTRTMSRNMTTSHVIIA